MQVAMIGAGYVGLVSGACFADFGHTVTCVDKDAGRIARLRKGKHLKVNVGKRVPNFSLEGMDEAMTALFACAAKYHGA